MPPPLDASRPHADPSSVTYDIIYKTRLSINTRAKDEKKTLIRRVESNASRYNNEIEFKNIRQHFALCRVNQARGPSLIAG